MIAEKLSETRRLPERFEMSTRKPLVLLHLSDTEANMNLYTEVKKIRGEVIPAFNNEEINTAHEILRPDILVVDDHISMGSSELKDAKRLGTTVMVIESQPRIPEMPIRGLRYLEQGADTLVPQKASAQYILRLGENILKRKALNIPQPREFIFDNVFVQLDKRCVSVDNYGVRLSATEWSILAQLVINNNRYMDRKELIAKSYGISYLGRERVFEGLNVWMCKLRGKLGHTDSISPYDYGYMIRENSSQKLSGAA